MMEYWLIKVILVVALLLIAYGVLRPIRNQDILAVRRIGMLILLLLATFAVIFPEIFNRLARAIGVFSGTNLLVYLLVIALFAQMATGYRRDATLRRNITELARQVALAQAAAEPNRDEGCDCDRGEESPILPTNQTADNSFETDEGSEHHPG